MATTSLASTLPQAHRRSAFLSFQATLVPLLKRLDLLILFEVILSC